MIKYKYFIGYCFLYLISALFILAEGESSPSISKVTKTLIIKDLESRESITNLIVFVDMLGFKSLMPQYKSDLYGKVIVQVPESNNYQLIIFSEKYGNTYVGSGDVASAVTNVIYIHKLEKKALPSHSLRN